MSEYRDAMAEIAAHYQQDHEASIFYALSLAAVEEPTDKTYASRLKAGAILEALFAVEPDHPGIAHYIIHTYDVPPLAGRALQAARRYSAIAADAPHALHMPSHTFTNGLVVDTRVYTPTNDLLPAVATNSGAFQMQHMAVVRDFTVMQ